MKIRCRLIDSIVSSGASGSITSLQSRHSSYPIPCLTKIMSMTSLRTRLGYNQWKSPWTKVISHWYPKQISQILEEKRVPSRRFWWSCQASPFLDPGEPSLWFVVAGVMLTTKHSYDDIYVALRQIFMISTRPCLLQFEAEKVHCSESFFCVHCWKPSDLWFINSDGTGTATKYSCGALIGSVCNRSSFVIDLVFFDT